METTESYDKFQTTYTIKNYLAQYNMAIGTLNKIKLTKYFVNYLISVYQFIIEYPKFNRAVTDKMNEIIIFINNSYNDDQADIILYDQVISNINYLLQLITIN